MRKRISAVLSFCMIVTLVFGNTGCGKMVDSYKKFNIEGFVEFFNIKSLEGKEEYICSGKLDIYKKEEILLLPFIKEISHTECAILVFPYSEVPDCNISIDEVSLTTADGNIISFIEDYGEIPVQSNWNSTMELVSTFNKSDEWFYNGNNLILYIKTHIGSESECEVTEFSYNVTIKGYRGTSLQV